MRKQNRALAAWQRIGAHGGVLGIVVALSSAALVIAGYAVGYRQLHAADLGALSAAAAFQQGRDPCAQAALTARQNGAREES